MAKSPPTDALLKRLQKLETAYARLGVLSTRIRAQADVISDLVSLAGALAADLGRPVPVPKSPAGRTSAPRTARAAKPAGRPSAAARASAAATTATAPRTSKRAAPRRKSSPAAKRARPTAVRRAKPASAGAPGAP